MFFFPVLFGSLDIRITVYHITYRDQKLPLFPTTRFLWYELLDSRNFFSVIFMLTCLYGFQVGRRGSRRGIVIGHYYMSTLTHLCIKLGGSRIRKSHTLLD